MNILTFYIYIYIYSAIIHIIMKQKIVILFLNV
jgi:hypothetical protein